MNITMISKIVITIAICSLAFVMIARVWRMGEIDPFMTLKVIKRNITNPFQFLDILQEKSKLTITFEKNKGFRFVTPTENAYIDGKDYKGNEQYIIKFTNEGGQEILDVDFDFQFPFLVTKSEVLHEQGARGCTFRPDLNIISTISGNGRVDVIGKIRTISYKLNVDRIFPKGFIELSVLLDRDKVNQETAVSGYGKMDGKSYYIIGNYFVEAKEHKFSKFLYFPFITTEDGSLDLGEAQETQPTGLRKIVGFN